MGSNLQSVYMRCLAAIFLLLVSVGSLAELSDVEKKLSVIAKVSQQDSIALLERVVNINSGTMNHTGVKQVADVFAVEFESLGFDTNWYDMSEVDRAGHLFAERKPALTSKGQCLLLIGHLDTVFEKDSAFQSFERDGDFATGPGVNDMKGGDVVIVQALKSLAAAGVLQDLHIIVAMIGDEEKSGSPKSISRYHLVEAAKRCDIALGFEIATGLQAATIARRGSSGWMLEVSGKRAHSSGIFSDRVGSGAIFEAARILNQFHEQLTGEQYLTFNPGVILGGTDVNYDASQNRGDAFGKTNVVAQTVTVHGGLRTISSEQEAEARASMKAIAHANHHRGTDAVITFSDGYPSMPPTQGNKAVLSKLNQVSIDLGYGPVEAYDPGKRGAADVSFIAEYVDAIDGIGAQGLGAHTPDENIDLSTLPMLVERASILIHRLGREENL
ncbi:MAG: M20/M25/M40 family metallo-hydrolase [Pseudomonadales bacterium]|nr:M20/M25/M40 family metallo-hydrolase [Pseudomonadales bacterium]MDG1444013.1 M20/M25/M40 family metallo-hydrolase [Pseudomonadales bacterium]